jgi:hypothetical protein
MKQILNEELFRIQEIMGVKKISINEDFQSEQNNLLFEQPGPFAKLIQRASKAGMGDATVLNNIDNIVKTQTDNFAKRSSRIQKGGYETLEDLSQAIGKGKIPADTVENLSKILIKQIINNPDGAKLLAKSWFEENGVTFLKQGLEKIKKGTDLSPKLATKLSDDFNLLLDKIKTGDPDIDLALKTSLDDVYGKTFRQAKASADEAVKAAEEFNAAYNKIMTEVKSKIKDDPDLAKNIDWGSKFEDEAREMLKTQSAIDVEDFLFKNLSRKTFVNWLQTKFKGVSWYKLIEYFRKKGFSLTLAVGGSVTLIFIILYFKKVAENNPKLKSAANSPAENFKDALPIAKEASEPLINASLSNIPQTELDNLYLKTNGYSIKYEENIGNAQTGKIEKMTVETPTKTYIYTLNDDSNSAKSEVIPKGGSSEVLPSVITATPTEDEFKKWWDGKEYADYDTGSFTVDGLNVTVKSGGTTYSYTKQPDNSFIQL